MIALLRGDVAYKGSDHAIIDVGGVGYRVQLPASTLAQLPPVGEAAVVHTHTHVREDALELFGFESPEDRAIFLSLTSINGVGVKLGMAILGTMSAPEVVATVARGDVRMLTSVKGVGKKTAERIVLELSDRFSNLSMPAGVAWQRDRAGGKPAEETKIDKLRSGLMNLGYPAQIVEKTILDLGTSVDEQELEPLFRAALSRLRS